MHVLRRVLRGAVDVSTGPTTQYYYTSSNRQIVRLLRTIDGVQEQNPNLLLRTVVFRYHQNSISIKLREIDIQIVGRLGRDEFNILVVSPFNTRFPKSPSNTILHPHKYLSDLADPHLVL